MMGINPKNMIRKFLFLLSFGLILTVVIANGQTPSVSSAQKEVATDKSLSVRNGTSNGPIFTDYRGIAIGMSADDVRSKLDQRKKDDPQDVVVFSDRESAQIYYDKSGKVMAISVDYVGTNSNAPSPTDVLGMELEPKADGSMYKLRRYPEAGYWVSYNRTAGDDPIVTITMQKM